LSSRGTKVPLRALSAPKVEPLRGSIPTTPSFYFYNQFIKILSFNSVKWCAKIFYRVRGRDHNGNLGSP